MVQPFRRSNSYTLTAELRLQGLISDAEYEVNNILGEKKQTVSGRDLMTKGLDVTISDRPGAAVLEYKRVGY
jgi:hypothetical protein